MENTKPEIRRMPQELQAAVEFLLKTAKAHDACCAGFVFRAGDEMFITNFGSCTDMGDVRLFNSLCKVADQMKDENRVYTQHVDTQTQ